MSRSLGGLQRVIQAVLLEHNGPLQYGQIRTQLVLTKINFTSKLRTRDRSLKRALKWLVDRGEVIIVGGKGGPSEPYRYVAIESIASTFKGEKVTDIAEAKKIFVVAIQSMTEQFARKLSELDPDKL